MSDWADWERRMAAAGADDIDDIVDDLGSLALSRAPDLAAGPILGQALRLAVSEGSKRRAATALAYAAGPQDTEAVDALEDAYRQARDDPSLGPGILGALGLLALRSPAARAAALGFLHRLKLSDSRYLLVAGAKIIGVLCDRTEDKDLRQRLDQLASAEDPAIASEAHQQTGLLRLGDAFLVEKGPELHARLRGARDSFAQAVAMEEVRPDAALFVLLLDLVLRFDSLKTDRDTAAREIANLTARVRGTVGGLGQRVFQGFRSDAAARVAGHALDIAESLEKAANEAAEAPRWTNFDRSLARLAECYALIRYRPAALPGQERLGAALEAFADRVLRPRMAPVLMRNVGRERFAQVIRNYETERGEDDILRGLRVLEGAAFAAEQAVRYRLSEAKRAELEALAERNHCTPDELVDEFIVVIDRNEVGEWASRIGVRVEGPSQQIHPDQREGLHAALIDAFTKEELGRMLHFRMDMRLDHIAGDGNLSKVAHEVISWAERAGRVQELVREARAFVPGNPTLRAFAEQFGREST
jgi:hypothetical protein